MSPNSNHFKNSGKHDVEIFKLFAQCIDKFGPKTFKEKLKTELSQHHFSNSRTRAVTEYIIKCVLTEYKQFDVTRDDLLNTKKRGYVNEARKICILLIRKNIKTPAKKLVKLIGNGNSDQIIYRVLREHSRIDRTSRVKAVQDFIKRHDAIEEKVNAYIPKIKVTNTEVEDTVEN